MIRILDWEPFVMALVTLLIGMVIVVVNVGLWVKYKHNSSMIFFHGASVFLMGCLISYFIGIATRGIPLSEGYLMTARTMLLLAAIGVCCCTLVPRKMQVKDGFLRTTQNLMEASKQIDDIVFIVDIEGVISHVNHPNQLKEILGSVHTMAEIWPLIEEPHGDKMSAFCETWRDGRFQRDIYIEHLASIFLILLAPLMVKGEFVGMTAVVTDVTHIRSMEQELLHRNQQLAIANDQLKDYIRVEGALDAEKERLQILTALQQTLVSDIESALSKIKSLKTRVDESATYNQAFRTFAQELRQVYQKVRYEVAQIAGKGEHR